MTLATTAARPNALPAYADAALLVLVLAASSDALIRLGVQSPVWMVCYALALLRISTAAPLAGVLIANTVLLALPLVCVLSAIWSRTPTETLTDGIQLLMTVVISIYLGWRYSLTVILRGLAGILTLAMAVSLLHWTTGVFPWPVTAGDAGVSGIFTHKNMLGQKGLIAAIVCLTLVLSGEVRWLAGLILALVAIAVAQSMTSVLLVPVALVALLILARRRVPGLSLVLTAGVILFSAAIPLAMALTGDSPVALALTTLGKSATLTGRTELWSIGADVIAAHPVLGVGYAAFATAPEFLGERLLMIRIGALKVLAFHNFLIELMVAAGLPGLIAALLFTGTTLSRLIRMRRATQSVAAEGALVVAATILVLSLLGASLYRQHELMIVLLALFAASAVEDARSFPQVRPRR